MTDDVGDRPEPNEATAPTVASKPNRTIDDTGDDAAPPADPGLAKTAVAEADAPAAPRRGIADLPTTSRELYAIEAEHARGGLGVILRAEDRRLERTVAIKELATNASDRAGTRFLREALITARLQHPGIVPVYEAGRWPDGSPYYAMKLVSGKTLREEVKARTKLEDRLALLPSVLAVAEAVAYAHANGVIHRDLKPDNVLIGKYGETIVVDWGLAKDRRQTTDELRDAGLYARAHAEGTRIGAILGTPAYMAPEQARGEDVDERADVWALGAILYYVLAAAPPFEGAPEVVIARVAEEAPPTLAQRASGAPRDLLAIVTKAMAREPERRYADAKALADDLSRFLTGQLVGAREYGRLARIEHWIRQNSAPVGVAAVLLVVLAAVATYSVRKILHERRDAEESSDKLLLTQASSQLDRDPTAAIAWLKQYPDNGADWESVRTIAADASSRGVARHVWSRHNEAVTAVSVSDDGKLVASASGDVVQFWDAGLGVHRGRLTVPEVNVLSFAPGKKLICGGTKGEVVVVSPETLSLRVLGKASGVVVALAISPDGKWFASGDMKGHIWMWPMDGSSGREITRLGSAVHALTIVEGGAAIASIDDDTMELRRTPLDGRPTETLLRIGAGVADKTHVKEFALRTDARAVVIGYDERLLVWDVGDQAPTELGRHRGNVTVVAIDGDHIVSGADDGTVLESVGHKPARMLAGHLHPINALAFAAGDRFASGDTGGEVRVWSPYGHTALRGHDGKIYALAFARDGTLYSASHDRSVRGWPPIAPSRVVPIGGILYGVHFRSSTEFTTIAYEGDVTFATIDGAARTIARHGFAVYDLATFTDRRFATSSWNGSIFVFAPDGTKLRSFDHGAKIWHLAASPDGHTLASTGINGVVWLWNIDTGTSRKLEERNGVETRDVAFTPDGRTVITTATDSEIHVFDLTHAGAEPRVLPEAGLEPRSPIFDHTGVTLYTAATDGKVRVWDLATGARRELTGHDSYVRSIALSPDERYLASGGGGGSVIVWDLTRDDAKITLRGHTAEVRHVAFSPVGHVLASAGFDGVVRLWDLDDHSVTVWRGHEDSVHRIAFSPDGQRVASSSADGTVRVWSVDDASSIPTQPTQLRDWLAGATTSVVDNETSAISVERIVTP